MFPGPSFVPITLAGLLFWVGLSQGCRGMVCNRSFGTFILKCLTLKGSLHPGIPTCFLLQDYMLGVDNWDNLQVEDTDTLFIMSQAG